MAHATTKMCMPSFSRSLAIPGNGPADAPAATENTAAKEGETK